MSGEALPELRRADVFEVIGALTDYPERESNFWLRNFPRGSCSITSYAIGRLLLDRHGEHWFLLHHDAERDNALDIPVDYSHVWLSLDPLGKGPTIDASIHQFTELGTEGPYLGDGPSPFESRFATPAQRYKSIRVDEVEAWWHHGQTIEVYEWLFPRLGVEWSAPK